VASVSTGVAVASLMFVALSRPRDQRSLVDPIAVQIEPSAAVVRLNGVVLGVGSQVIARPMPGVSLSVDVRSSDGVSQTVEITSESPARIQLNLGRKGDAGTAAPPGSRGAPAPR
jgi:serine/threonine-protein kinase